MEEDRIRADLAARYPEGYYSFTRGGKRSAVAVIRPVKIGYTVNVNGDWHVYDREGRLVSHWHGTSWPGHTLVTRRGTTERRDGA